MFDNSPYPSYMLNDDIIQAFEPDYFYQHQPALKYMAIDAYIYGYPLVLTDVTKRIMLADGLHINQFLNERAFPTPQYTTIVRPNVDTLYSMAWLDLSRETIILDVPDTHNRYYLIELLDAWTNVFASIGARTTGTRTGAFAITGPEWNGILPEGTIRVGSPTNIVWLIGRTQTNGSKDYPLVHALQDKYNLIPLSHWEIAGCKNNNSGYNNSNSGTRPTNINPADRVAMMDAATFFQTMMQAISVNPPWIEDPAMNKVLTMLGLVPSKSFDFFSLDPSVQHALVDAAAYGPRLISAEAKNKYIKNNINGWNVLLKNIGFYGADYIQRAMVAMTGIGANLPQDSVYYPAFTDAAGIQLVGYNNYVIHFKKNQFPPVNAFWSITAYNDKGYLADNPINRYAIGSHFGRLNYNIDGSLDIFVGNATPGKNNAANWLPTPEGLFNLVLRMYWPSQSVLSGQWTPPAIKREPIS